MSKDLPMWDDDESEVKLEYRFQYGHVLIAMRDLDRLLKKICTVFKLGKSLTTFNDIQQERLPCEKNITLLSNDTDWHFILAKYKENIAVFGPHRLFLGSYGWSTVSRKLRVQLSCAHVDFDAFYHTIFNNGKHICNAIHEPNGIHQLKMEPIEFYINGKMFYKVDKEKDLLTEDLKKFISSDINICIDEYHQIRFKKPLSEYEYVEPNEILHAVFNAKSQKDIHRHGYS